MLTFPGASDVFGFAGLVRTEVTFGENSARNCFTSTCLSGLNVRNTLIVAPAVTLEHIALQAREF
jgi:hypothetical protein